MKLQRALAILILSAVLSSAWADKPSGRLDRAVKEAVRNRLKDPESARFEGLDTFLVDGARITCGYVNAKNSYGGYVGRTRFWTTGSDTAVQDVAIANGETREVIDDWCDRDLARAKAIDDAKVRRAELAEEKSALCPPNTTANSPGTCGELHQQCEKEFGWINYRERNDYLKFCRRQGLDAAKAKWDASMGQTITFSPK